jgi:nicotinamidase/pyrazinamidase
MSVDRYDARTALLVVDVQNDFADPSGSLYVAGGEKIVPLINQEIEEASKAGARVIYSQDWHPQTTPHFKKDGGVWPEHCVGASWGAAFYPALKVLEGAPTIRKGTSGEDGYSVFSVRDPHLGTTYPTELEGILRQHGIERLVIVGLATDYCVKETSLDGLRLGFEVEVLAGAVRAVDLHPGDGEKAFAAVVAAGGRIS